MITQKIFDWATKAPDKIAVIYNGTPHSYRAFAEWIARARGHYSRQGLVGDGHVVLAVQSLLDFWIISLALRSLGLTTIAVPSAADIGDLRLPNIRGVVTTPLDAWAGLDEMCSTHGLRLSKESPVHDLPLWLDASTNTCPPGGHILRTSGTTGNNKMVLMSPDCDAVMLRRKAEVFKLSRDSVQCVFNFPPWTAAGYRFPASAWYVGGTSLIEQNPKPYLALQRPGITHAVLVPGMLSSILAAPTDAFPRNDAMQLAVGGGTMTRAQVEQATARITVRLSNWLASTEAGGVALTPLETPEDHRWQRLIPDRVVEVVDDLDCPVPAGQVGRVRIRADGGPTSYLYDEVATQEFFRDGFFYPGDLAVIRADGRMALQGRLTDVINIRGQKFSPAPIEDRLCEALGVTGVCLFTIQNNEGEEGLHVVIESPSPVSQKRLADALGKGVQGFPFVKIHYVKALARNQMGKVLRQAVKSQAIPVSE